MGGAQAKEGSRRGMHACEWWEVREPQRRELGDACLLVFVEVSVLLGK